MKNLLITTLVLMASSCSQLPQKTREIASEPILGNEVGNRSIETISASKRKIKIVKQEYLGKNKSRMTIQLEEGDPDSLPYSCVAIYNDSQMKQELTRSCDESSQYKMVFDIDSKERKSFYTVGIVDNGTNNTKMFWLENQVNHASRNYWESLKIDPNIPKGEYPVAVNITKLNSTSAGSMVFDDQKKHEVFLNQYEVKFHVNPKVLNEVRCVIFTAPKIVKMENKWIPKSPQYDIPAWLDDKDKIEICNNDDNIDAFAREIEDTVINIGYYEVPEVIPHCFGKLLAEIYGAECPKIWYSSNDNVRYIADKKKYGIFIYYKNRRATVFTQAVPLE